MGFRALEGTVPTPTPQQEEMSLGLGVVLVARWAWVGVLREAMMHGRGGGCGGDRRARVGRAERPAEVSAHACARASLCGRPQRSASARGRLVMKGGCREGWGEER